jgi:hypothetical protein
MTNESNSKTLLLKSLLIFQTLAVMFYTVLAVKNEGMDLFPVFISNITQMGWNGQFNLDFSMYLVLSGIWIMWRNKWSISSIFIGVSAMILGIVFFAPYLLFLVIKEKGNLQKIATAN